MARSRSDRLVAVLGESQVGKSSLVNSLLDVELLPTFGKGTTCTRTVCEVGWSRDRSDSWRVGLEWANSEPAWRSLPEIQRGIVEAALREDTLTQRQARAHIEFLAETWTEGCLAKINVSPPAYDLVLVDVPGFGHDDDGGVAAHQWLASNAKSVAAVLCVHGMRSPAVLGDVLRKYWTGEELQSRLYCVATWADGYSRRPGSSLELAQRERRLMAAHWIVRMTDMGTGCSVSESVYSRTFCCDPRPDDEFVRDRVEFVGELDRLRTTLAGVSVPAPRPPRVSGPAGPEQDQPGFGVAPGESFRDWLARVVGPRLRRPKWVVEPAKGGGERHVLVAESRSGKAVRVITISGSGSAWLKLSDPIDTLTEPCSVAEARAIHDRVVDLAVRHDIVC